VICGSRPNADVAEMQFSKTALYNLKLGVKQFVFKMYHIINASLVKGSYTEKSLG